MIVVRVRLVERAEFGGVHDNYVYTNPICMLMIKDKLILVLMTYKIMAAGTHRSKLLKSDDRYWLDPIVGE